MRSLWSGSDQHDRIDRMIRLVESDQHERCDPVMWGQINMVDASVRPLWSEINMDDANVRSLWGQTNMEDAILLGV